METALESIIHSNGLRLSLVGAVVFLFGLATLTFLPTAAAVLVTLGGGLLVWAGFIWTLAIFYVQPAPDTPEEPGEASDAEDERR